MEAFTLMRSFRVPAQQELGAGKWDLFLRNSYTCGHFFTFDSVKKEGFGFPSPVHFFRNGTLLKPKA